MRTNLIIVKIYLSRASRSGNDRRI